MATTQVAVRLEMELLEQLDWLVLHCEFENRAEAMRAAVTELAKREREREIDEQIVAAYQRQPQTDEEVSWSEGRGFPGVPVEDWDGWFDGTG